MKYWMNSSLPKYKLKVVIDPTVSIGSERSKSVIREQPTCFSSKNCLAFGKSLSQIVEANSLGSIWLLGIGELLCCH